MARTAAICVLSIFSVTSVYSQNTGDRLGPHRQYQSHPNSFDPYALTFSPGPVSDDVAIGPDANGEAESESGDTAAPPTTARFTELVEAIREVEEAIAREESLNGPTSPRLVAQLESLAEVYRELGDIPFVIATLDRARQIIRANNGLYSLSQLRVLENTIDTMEEAGAYDSSDVLQSETLELADRNADDPRAPTMIAGIADRQMDAVKEYIETGAWDRSGLHAPGYGWDLEHLDFLRDFSGRKSLNRLDGTIRDVLTSDDYAIGDTPNARDLLAETYSLIDVINDHNDAGLGVVGIVDEGLILYTRDLHRQMALAALRRARRLYSDALQRMLESGDYGDADFLAIEQELVDSYWYELEHTELYPLHTANPNRASPRRNIYGTGTSALEAHVVLLISRGASAIQIAHALMAVGDWHLLFAENGSALATYRDAYDFLTRGDVPTEAWTEIVFPETPFVLAHLADDYSAEFDPTRTYSGYLDFAIETGRFGQVKEAEIVGRSERTSASVETRGRKHVFGTRFRPRFEDGRPLRSDRFTLRYYYDGSELATGASGPQDPASITPESSTD